jgi:hypothetical protein
VQPTDPYPAVLPRGSRIAPSARVAPVERADGIVLVDVSGGQRITLDAFGSNVWRLLADQPTLPLLLERLRDEHTRADRVAEDVARLLMRWLELGVIAWR